MKNVICSFALLFLCQLAFAQGESTANALVLGGSFNINSQTNTYPLSTLNINTSIGSTFSNSTDDIKSFNFSFTPYVGKELSDNWMLALELDYRLSNYSNEDFFDFLTGDEQTFERKANQFSVGVFARYLINPTNKLNFYLRPNVRYNLLGEERFIDNEMTQEEKARYIQLGVGAGALYNINNRWRILLNVGGVNYTNGSWEIVDTNIEKDFSAFSTSLSLASIRFGLELKI